MARYEIKGLPWQSKIGVNVKDCTSTEEVINKARLNWTVEKCDLFAEMPMKISDAQSLKANVGDFAYAGRMYRACPNGYATYRTDINVPLGVVKSKYEVIQNRDAFDFFDSAIGEDMAKFQYAGYFGYGHKVFITAKLPIETTVGGDPIDNYLVFSTSHDGTGSIDILFTPVRVFCLNCLNAAFHENSAHIRIRHTQSAKDKLDFGAEVLNVAINYASNTQLLYEGLRGITMTDDQVRDYISRLQLTDKELEAINTYDSKHGIRRLFDRDYMIMDKAEISTRKSNIITTMFDYYHNGVAQEEIVGTAWGAYNAITGYYSNVKNQEGEKRMDNLIFGGDRLASSRALNLLTEYKAA